MAYCEKCNCSSCVREREQERSRNEFARNYILVEKFYHESDAHQYANRISGTLHPIVRSGMASRPGGGPPSQWFYVYIRRP